MKIYTKSGDKGMTSLLGGARVKKSHARIEAYGTCDELNAWVGLIRDQDIFDRYSEQLREIQDRLFTIGSVLATDPNKDMMGLPDLKNEDVQALEIAMDTMSAELPELRSFILPGGHQIVSYCHLARTVCRRCERLIIRLQEEEGVNDMIVKYVNRLSDYFFVLSRKLALDNGVTDVAWTPRR